MEEKSEDQKTKNHLRIGAVPTDLLYDVLCGKKKREQLLFSLDTAVTSSRTKSSCLSENERADLLPSSSPSFSSPCPAHRTCSSSGTVNPLSPCIASSHTSSSTRSRTLEKKKKKNRRGMGKGRSNPNSTGSGADSRSSKNEKRVEKEVKMEEEVRGGGRNSFSAVVPPTSFHESSLYSSGTMMSEGTTSDRVPAKNSSLKSHHRHHDHHVHRVNSCQTFSSPKQWSGQISSYRQERQSKMRRRESSSSPRHHSTRLPPPPSHLPKPNVFLQSILSILGVVPPSQSSSPPSSPLLLPLQDSYARITTHMSSIIAAFDATRDNTDDDATSVVGGILPSSSSAGVEDGVTLGFSRKGEPRLSVESLLFQAIQEVEALPKGVRLHRGREEEKGSENDGHRVRAPPAPTVSTVSLSSHLSTHPPIFFAALLGSALALLLHCVWSAMKIQHSSLWTACSSTISVSPFSLTASASASFSAHKRSNNHSGPDGSTINTSAGLEAATPSPFCTCAPKDGTSQECWSLLQRVQDGMKAYESFIQEVLSLSEQISNSTSSGDDHCYHYPHPEEHCEGREGCETGVRSPSSGVSPPGMESTMSASLRSSWTSPSFPQMTSESSILSPAPSMEKRRETNESTMREGEEEQKRKKREEILWDQVGRMEEYELGWWSAIQLPLLYYLSPDKSQSSMCDAIVRIMMKKTEEKADRPCSLRSDCLNVLQRAQEAQKMLLRTLMHWEHLVATHADNSPSPSSFSLVVSLESPHVDEAEKMKEMEKNRKRRLLLSRLCWSSFQRARRSVGSLLSVLPAKHSGAAKNGNSSLLSSEDSSSPSSPVFDSCVAGICAWSIGCLAQRWEWCAAAETLSHATRTKYPHYHDHESPSPPSPFVTLHRLNDVLQKDVVKKVEQLKEYVDCVFPHEKHAPLNSMERVEVSPHIGVEEGEREKFSVPYPSQEWMEAPSPPPDSPRNRDDDPTSSSPPPPPAICHRTIHTSLNLLLADLCQDPLEWDLQPPDPFKDDDDDDGGDGDCREQEGSVSRAEIQPPPPPPLEASTGSKRPAATTATTTERKWKTRNPKGEKHSLFLFSQLETRVYVIQRLSSLLHALKQIYFFSPPSATSSSSHPPAWVLRLHSQLVRVCLEVELENSFLVYGHFRLLPQTPIDPVPAFASEQMEWSEAFSHIQRLKWMRAWRESLTEREKGSVSDAPLVPSSSSPLPAWLPDSPPPPPFPSSTSSVSSTVKRIWSLLPSSALSFFSCSSFLSSIPPSSSTLRMEAPSNMREERKREGKEGERIMEEGVWDEGKMKAWYLPSAVLAYNIQLRARCTEFIYHVFLFWCGGRSGILNENSNSNKELLLSSSFSSCDLPPSFSSLEPKMDMVRRNTGDEGGTSEEDCQNHAENRSTTTSTISSCASNHSRDEGETNELLQTENGNKNNEEEYKMRLRRKSQGKIDEEVQDGRLIRMFLGKFENTFNSLLRRHYLFGTQEAELLSMWFVKKMWVEESSMTTRFNICCQQNQHVHSSTTVRHFPENRNKEMTTTTTNTAQKTRKKEENEEKRGEKGEANINREDQNSSHDEGGIANPENSSYSFSTTLSTRIGGPLWVGLHTLISSLPLRDATQDVYRYFLQSFLYLRDILSSASSLSVSPNYHHHPHCRRGAGRVLGAKCCFTACGVALSQAMEVAYFLVLCDQRWPHLLHSYGGRGGNGGNEEEEEYSLSAPSAIQEYAHEVCIILEHSTAKQLWYLRSRGGAAAATPGVNNQQRSDALFYFTGESRSHVYPCDPALRWRQGQSILSVVHAHLIHPSLLWAPLWQVHELLIIFDYCVASPRSLTEKKMKKSTQAKDIQEEEEGVEARAEHFLTGEESPAVVQTKLSATKDEVEEHKGGKLYEPAQDGKMMRVEITKKEEYFEKEDEEEEYEEEEEEWSRLIVVGNHQSNLSLFHGYLVLRIYVISNVLRQLRRAWTEELWRRRKDAWQTFQGKLTVFSEKHDVVDDDDCHPHNTKKRNENIHDFPYPDSHHHLPSTVSWGDSSIERKLQALSRLEQFEPERERHASGGGIHNSNHHHCDQPVPRSLPSSSSSRKPRTWAVEMVKDLMSYHSYPQPPLRTPLNRTDSSGRRNSGSEVLRELTTTTTTTTTISSSSGAAAAATSPAPSLPPHPRVSLRCLAARMECVRDDCWGAIRSIQRLEKMIQMAAKKKLLFHVLQDRQERWRAAEEMEGNHLIDERRDRKKESVGRRKKQQPQLQCQSSPPPPHQREERKWKNGTGKEKNEVEKGPSALTSSWSGKDDLLPSFSPPLQEEESGGGNIHGTNSLSSPHGRSLVENDKSLDVLFLSLHRHHPSVSMGFVLNASTMEIIRVQEYQCHTGEAGGGGGRTSGLDTESEGAKKDEEDEDKLNQEGRKDHLHQFCDRQGHTGASLPPASTSSSLPLHETNRARPRPSSTSSGGEREGKAEKISTVERTRVLTPIASAVCLVPELASVYRLVGYYVAAVDQQAVKNGKDVAKLVAGKTSFTLRLEKKQRY